MITILIGAVLFVFGAAFGSFAAAQVWRLRARQLASDKKAGERVTKKDQAQVAILSGRMRGVAHDRSMCLHCGRILAWYDLLPIVSWLSHGGKCRTCHKRIGTMELWAEVGLGVAFMVSYLVWPYGYDAMGVVLLAIWLVMLVLMAIHWMYDAKWFLLLDAITTGVLLAALLFLAFRLTTVPSPFIWESLTKVGWTLLVLPGFYGLLYVLSRGKWIGLGDVKLLVPFALILPSWEYGVLLIFLANLIGCIVLLPGMATKRITRSARVPFGPFLIAAFILSVLFGQKILDFYIGTLLF